MKPLSRCRLLLLPALLLLAQCHTAPPAPVAPRAPAPVAQERPSPAAPPPAPLASSQPLRPDCSLPLPAATALNITFTHEGHAYRFYGFAELNSRPGTEEGCVRDNLRLNANIFNATSFDYGEDDLRPDGFWLFTKQPLATGKKMRWDGGQVVLRRREYLIDAGSFTLSGLAAGNRLSGTFRLRLLDVSAMKPTEITDGRFDAVPTGCGELDCSPTGETPDMF